MNKHIRISYRIFFALLALGAVVTQLVYGLSHTGLDPVNFYSYFTIESNIFALVVFLVAAKAAHTGKKDRSLDYIRGAATLYMTITGIIYSLLLTGVDVNVPLPWVNAILHYIFPVAVLVDWLTDKPAHIIRPQKALVWLSFPLAYFIYCLIRGHFVGWYPYPFMNAMELGYAKLIMNALIIGFGMAILAIMLAKLGAPAAKTPKGKKSTT